MHELNSLIINQNITLSDARNMLARYGLFAGQLITGEWFFNSECYSDEERPHFPDEYTCIREAAKYGVKQNLAQTLPRKYNRGKETSKNFKREKQRKSKKARK